MLFVATHTHTPESCPAGGDLAPLHLIASTEHAAKCKVKVLGSYAAPPEHTFYFVLDAKDYPSIVEFFRPLMKIGAPRITPVETLQQTVGVFPVKSQTGRRRASRA